MLRNRCSVSKRSSPVPIASFSKSEIVRGDKVVPKESNQSDPRKTATCLGLGGKNVRISRLEVIERGGELRGGMLRTACVSVTISVWRLSV